MTPGEEDVEPNGEDGGAMEEEFWAEGQFADCFES